MGNKKKQKVSMIMDHSRCGASWLRIKKTRASLEGNNKTIHVVVYQPFPDSPYDDVVTNEP
jgi:hypothetical protein